MPVRGGGGLSEDDIDEGQQQRSIGVGDEGDQEDTHGAVHPLAISEMFAIATLMALGTTDCDARVKGWQ